MSSLQQENSSNGAPALLIGLSEVMDAAGDSDSRRPLLQLLFASGFSTMLMALATALYKPPRGVVFDDRHKLAYYLVLAGIFVAGLAEVSAAFWLSKNGRGRALLKAILCASVVPLVAVVALGGFAVIMKP